MARAPLVLFLACFVAMSNGFLTKGRNLEPVFSKDEAVPQESQDAVENKLEVESAPVEIESVAQESSVMKECAKIGEFCMNHSDCCTNACLGYMKRCVS